MNQSNDFAVIPAAGRSLRMGSQHKLMLPWNGETVVDQIFRAWTGSLASRVVIIVRADDLELQQACERWPTIELLVAEEPPEDMKRSIQLGLRRIADQCQPTDADRWITAPADLPTLSTELVNLIIEASRACHSILAPRFGGRRGHPVSFPWSLVPEVFNLGVNDGINKLLAGHEVKWLDLPAEQYPDDLDTPSDYSRLSKGYNQG